MSSFVEDRAFRAQAGTDFQISTGRNPTFDLFRLLFISRCRPNEPWPELALD
jgi:hypothetical protein